MQITEENLKKIKSQIVAIEQRYQRAENSVQLMAVSKKKPVELIRSAYLSGQRIFGESYVQEAVEKKGQLSDLTDIEWHFIGPIQSNKTRDLANNFDWIHSVDRVKTMSRLNDQRVGKPINICLQLNIDNEGTKLGFKVAELMAVAKRVMELPNLTLRGLMVIPKPRDNLAEQRRVFNQAHDLFVDIQSLSNNIDTLSMGMSGDMEAAIAEGSTIVRIGTAIFGTRG